MWLGQCKVDRWLEMSGWQQNIPASYIAWQPADVPKNLKGGQNKRRRKGRTPQFAVRCKREAETDVTERWH